MARPLLPPKFINVPADIAYDRTMPAGVFRTYVQLWGLMWGKEDEAQDFTLNQLMEVTGLSKSALYGHLAVLRDRCWLLSSSTQYRRITIYGLHGGAYEAETTNENEGKAVDNPVDKSVDKSVDNLSRYLDSSIKEVFKDLTLNPDINLPPNNLVNPREEVVRISGQSVQKSGQEAVETQETRTRGKKSLTPSPPLSPSKEGVGRQAEGVGSERNNGWHDVIAPDLERKLVRLGVFAPVYGMVANELRSGEWSEEQVHRLADQVIDEQAGAGVFVYRLKNKIRPETANEKQEKAIDRFRELYVEQRSGNRE